MKKKVLSAVTAGLLAVSMASPVFAMATTTKSTDPGSGESQVTLTGVKTPAEVGQLSVTAPTTIPLAVADESGAITSGNLAITNNSKNVTATVASATISDKSTAFTFASSVGSMTTSNRTSFKDTLFVQINGGGTPSSGKDNKFTLADNSKTFDGWTIEPNTTNPTDGTSSAFTVDSSSIAGALTSAHTNDEVALINWVFTGTYEAEE